MIELEPINFILKNRVQDKTRKSATFPNLTGFFKLEVLCFAMIYEFLPVQTCRVLCLKTTFVLY